MSRKKNPYPMSPYPLHLQFPATESGTWDVALRRKTDEQEIEMVSLPTPGLAEAYGRAVFASSRLHHVLTDFAVAMTDEEVSELHTMPSGPLRQRILVAADDESYAGVRPFLHGWDNFLGQQSIRYRNHIIHGQMWHQDGQDRIGRIEEGRYTELTEGRLVWLTAGISRSFRLLNQIFWDVLQDEHAGTPLIRESQIHGFHSRQAGFFSDVRAQLPYLLSHVIPASTDAAA